MNRTQLSERIRNEWPKIVRRSQVTVSPTLPKGPIRLLGSSLKTEKGEGFGVLTAVLYGSAADRILPAGQTNCPDATAECRAACLGHTSGRLVMGNAQNAQAFKTALRRGAPDLFFQLLHLDIEAHEKKAKRLGLAPRVRLDGSTDLGDAERMAEKFPNVGFYDYTKSAARAARWERLRIPNLSVTLSYSGENPGSCMGHLRNGGRVAVATDLAKNDPKPSTLWGFPTVDGDQHDDRSQDPAGHVVLLSWKGPRAGLDTAGPFAVRIRE